MGGAAVKWQWTSRPNAEPQEITPGKWLHLLSMAAVGETFSGIGKLTAAAEVDVCKSVAQAALATVEEIEQELKEKAGA